MSHEKLPPRPVTLDDGSLNAEYLHDTWGMSPEFAQQRVTFNDGQREFSGTVADMLADTECPVGGRAALMYQKNEIKGVVDYFNGLVTVMGAEFEEGVELSVETIASEDVKKKSPDLPESLAKKEAEDEPQKKLSSEEPPEVSEPEPTPEHIAKTIPEAIEVGEDAVVEPEIVLSEEIPEQTVVDPVVEEMQEPLQEVLPEPQVFVPEVIKATPTEPAPVIVVAQEAIISEPMILHEDFPPKMYELRPEILEPLINEAVSAERPQVVPEQTMQVNVSEATLEPLFSDTMVTNDIGEPAPEPVIERTPFITPIEAISAPKEVKPSVLEPEPELFLEELRMVTPEAYIPPDIQKVPEVAVVAVTSEEQVNVPPVEEPVTETLMSEVQLYIPEAEEQPKEEEPMIQVVVTEEKITISAKLTETIESEEKAVEVPIATLSQLEEAFEHIFTVLDSLPERVEDETGKPTPEVDVIVTEEVLEVLQLFHEDEVLFIQSVDRGEETPDQLVTFTTGGEEPIELQVTHHQVEVMQEVIKVLTEDENLESEETITIEAVSEPVDRELVLLLGEVKEGAEEKKEVEKRDISEELFAVIKKERILVEAVLKLKAPSEAEELVKKKEKQELTLVSGEEEMKIDVEMLEKIMKLRMVKQRLREANSENVDAIPLEGDLPLSEVMQIEDELENGIPNREEFSEALEEIVIQVDDAVSIGKEELALEVSEEVLTFLEVADLVVSEGPEEELDEGFVNINIILTSGKREIVIDLRTLKKLQHLMTVKQQIPHALNIYEGAPEEIKTVVQPYQASTDPSLLLIYQSLLYAFGLEDQKVISQMPFSSRSFSSSSHTWYN